MSGGSPSTDARPVTAVRPQANRQPLLVNDALASLADAGIKVCLLRDDPETWAEAGELDLLVPLKELNRAVGVLTSRGWERLDPQLLYPHKAALVCYDGHAFKTLDLHGSLIDRGLVYLDADWYWATAKRHGPLLSVPSSGAWLLHCCLHVVLGKKALPDKYIDRLRRLTLGPAERGDVLRQANRFGLQRIVEVILKDPLTVLSDRRQVRQLRRRAMRRLLSRPANLSRFLGRKLCWGAIALAGLRRGALIAVLGPDGAGKTTFIAALEAQMRSLGVPVRTAYMGPWYQPVLPSSWLLDHLGAGPVQVGSGANERWHRRAARALDPSGQLRRWLYHLNLPLELMARYGWRVLRHRLKWRTVIADRYLFDLDVGYQNIVIEGGTKGRRFIYALLPKPDVAILLDNDAEVIWKRKQEFPLHTIERVLGVYRRIASEHGFRVIRTDRSPDELASQFLAGVWRDVVDYRRRIGFRRAFGVGA